MHPFTPLRRRYYCQRTRYTFSVTLDTGMCLFTIALSTMTSGESTNAGAIHQRILIGTAIHVRIPYLFAPKLTKQARTNFMTSMDGRNQKSTRPVSATIWARASANAVRRRAAKVSGRGRLELRTVLTIICAAGGGAIAGVVFCAIMHARWKERHERAHRL